MMRFLVPEIGPPFTLLSSAAVPVPPEACRLDAIRVLMDQPS